MFHAEGLQHGPIDEREDVCAAQSFRDMRGEQNRHARILILRAGSKLQRRPNSLRDELRERSVAFAQRIVSGQLIGQARDVREQMLHRDVVVAVAGELRNEFLDGIGKPKLTPIKERHQRRHANRLRDRAEQEHGVGVTRTAEHAAERRVGLRHM